MACHPVLASAMEPEREMEKEGEKKYAAAVDPARCVVARRTGGETDARAVEFSTSVRLGTHVTLHGAWGEGLDERTAARIIATLEGTAKSRTGKNRRRRR